MPPQPTADRAVPALVLGIVGTVLLGVYVLVFVIGVVFIGLLLGGDCVIFNELSKER